MYVLLFAENHQDFILISTYTQEGEEGGYSRFKVTRVTKGFFWGRKI